MVTRTKGAHYTPRIFARFMHIRARYMHAPQFYCLTFGAESTSSLAQSSTADQPWMAHGGNTMGPFKWSHTYVRWDVSENILWEFLSSSDFWRIFVHFQLKY